MNTLKLTLILLMLGAAGGCDQQKKTDDPEALKKVLTDYFDGIKNKDLKKMNAVTTSDFILLEDGKIWSNESFINAAKSSGPFQGTWTFDYKRIIIDDSSGSIVYLNRGDFVVNDTSKMKIDWLESATFRKADGVWKMNLLHSSVKK